MDDLNNGALKFSLFKGIVANCELDLFFWLKLLSFSLMFLVFSMFPLNDVVAIVVFLLASTYNYNSIISS